ncbi:ATP-binding protein [Rhizomonospora bruguierae]|uniref:ATP-binding protein n=1 Tax=Rhizomonospora bruguierae TaxID=1581705 RepID=UPI001BD136DB|nr:ATP-binding protein [Micromonospora sp. NBRC 107566]
MFDASPDLSPLLLVVSFGRAQVRSTRHAVARAVAAAGLTGTRADDFVLAVNELITNAVRHAGGRGRLLLGLAGSAIACDIIDTGGGIPASRLRRHELPAEFAVGGRGIWLARHLCDLFQVETGPHGTTIRVAVALPSGVPGVG